MLIQILEILKYTLPSFILLVVVYMLVKKFTEHDLNKQKVAAFGENHKLVTPLRLQAYERMLLFLERITIESLALRLQTPGISSRQLQIAMLEAIRKEFNHNLSQQLYLSKKSWNAVKNAKEQVIRNINVAGTQMNPQMKGQDFTKYAMELYIQNDSQPVESAIEIVKSEASVIFGI
jgi:hypothetical protein